MPRNPLRQICVLCRDSKDYFRRDADTIQEQNGRSLARICSLYTIFLLSYAGIVHFVFHNNMLDWFYAVFFFMQFVLDCLILRPYWKGASLCRTGQGLCLFQMASIMAFIIVISVFPFPDRPGIFFSPLLLATCALFNLPFRKLIVSSVIYTAIFLGLAFVFKSPSGYIYDRWAALPTLVISFILIYTLCELRVKGFQSRWRWMVLSKTDQSTQLFNKTTAENLIRDHLANAAPDELCALFLLDVDNFKDINDRLGHAQGDVVLMQAANAIRACANDRDISGRFGGDEFMLLITNLPHPDAARQRAHKLLAHIERLCARPFARHPVSCSLGMAFGNAGFSYEEFFAQADKALYAAKAQGRNRIVISDLAAP